jgi:DNA-binding HxlR family transcriptional regulator
VTRRRYERFCPLSAALEDVGDRWTLVLVEALLGGPKRYADLRAFLHGSGSNVLSDRLRRLADAQIVGRRTGDHPGSETTYYLTERGKALAPVINSLRRWGMASLTLTAPGSAARPDREEFDQTWAIGDLALVADEAYQWKLDGVEMTLTVVGRQLIRTPGRAESPVVILSTTSAVLDSILAGEQTFASASRSGALSLRGAQDAVRRMFLAIGMPAEEVGL